MPKSLTFKKDHYKNYLSEVDFKFGIRFQSLPEELESKDKTSFYSYINNPLFYYNRVPVFKWRKKPVDIDGNNGPSNESYYNFLNDYVSKARYNKIFELITAAVNAKYISTHSTVEKHVANVKLQKIEELAISNAVLECLESLIDVLECEEKAKKANSENKCRISRNTIKDRVVEFVKRHFIKESEYHAGGKVFSESEVILTPFNPTSLPTSKYIKLGDLQGYQDSVIAFTREEVRSYSYVTDMVNVNSNGALNRLVSYLAKHDFLSKAIYAGAYFSRDGYNLRERKYERLESGILTVRSEKVSFTGRELREFDTEIRRVDLPNYIETYIKVYMIINYMLEDALDSILGNTLVKNSTTFYDVEKNENDTVMTVRDKTTTEIGRYTITLEPRFE